MLLLTFAEVLSRYFFHFSIAFAEEITINLFVWSVMVGAASAIKRGHHLGFTLITDALPYKLKRSVNIFVALICISILALIMWFGSKMVFSQILNNQKTPALELPEWVMGLSIPVGAMLCITRFAQNMLRLLRVEDRR